MTRAKRRDAQPRIGVRKWRILTAYARRFFCLIVNDKPPPTPGPCHPAPATTGKGGGVGCVSLSRPTWHSLKEPSLTELPIRPILYTRRRYSKEADFSRNSTPVQGPPSSIRHCQSHWIRWASSSTNLEGPKINMESEKRLICLPNPPELQCANFYSSTTPSKKPIIAAAMPDPSLDRVYWHFVHHDARGGAVASCQRAPSDESSGLDGYLKGSSETKYRRVAHSTV